MIKDLPITYGMDFVNPVGRMSLDDRVEGILLHAAEEQHERALRGKPFISDLDLGLGFEFRVMPEGIVIVCFNIYQKPAMPGSAIRKE